MTNGEKILQYALNEVGNCENPKNSNNIKYNTKYYGYEVSGSNYSWCCVFVWYVYIMCGLSKYFYNGNKTASCTTLMKWYMNNKPWCITTTPSKGSLVFYQFDNDPYADHIGIFDSWYSSAQFYAVEGNTSASNSGSQDNGDGVYRKLRKKTQVMCFIDPFLTKEEVNNITTNISGSSSVLDCQKWLNQYSCNSISEDGFYGKETKTAQIKVLQTIEKEDYKKNITIGGTFGLLTKLYCPYCKYGDTSRLVQIAKSILICNGYSCGGFNETFDITMKNSVIQFQKDNNLKQDGYFGKDCFTKAFK